MADPFYYSAGWLMPLDGANNSTVFTDYSLFNAPFIVKGNAKISTAQSKYRSGAMYLDGSAAGSYIAMGRFTGLNGSTSEVVSRYDLRGNYSVEAWVYPEDFSIRRYVYDQKQLSSGQNGPSLSFNTSGQLEMFESNVLRITHATAAVANTWNHVQLHRVGTTLEIRLNGVPASTTYNFAPTLVATDMLIGSSYANQGSSATDKFKGYIAEARFYWNVSPIGVIGATTTPPGAIDTAIPPLPKILSAVAVRPMSAFGIWTPAKKLIVPPIKIYDSYFGGTGRISGTTKVKGTPNYAIRRKVRLHRESDGAVAGEVWSDPATGAYAFNNVSTQYKYTVIAYDYEHNYRAVIADNLTPDPMP